MKAFKDTISSERNNNKKQPSNNLKLIFETLL